MRFLAERTQFRRDRVVVPIARKHLLPDPLFFRCIFSGRSRRSERHVAKPTPTPTEPAPREPVRELAQFLISEPELVDVNIIRASMNLDSLHRIAARHGFEAILDPEGFSLWEGVHRRKHPILAVDACV
jgi:hypothetical protein